MSLQTAVRSALKAGHKALAPLECTVTYERYLSADAYGAITYAAGVPLLAALDGRQTQRRLPSGILTGSRATLTFTDVAALSTASAGNGVSDKDRITLPDGTTGPILDVGGYIDPGTGLPFATEVYLK